MISTQSRSKYRPTPVTILVALIAIGCASADRGGPPPQLAHPDTNEVGPSAQGADSLDSITNSPDPFAELQNRFGRTRALSKQLGQATYYGNALAGNKTASGRVYDPAQPTMAHRTLPFGTVVRVTRTSNGAQVIVVVTDRGPFGNKRRIADLSREAASRLDMLRAGVVDVRLEVLKLGKKR